jgi:hypothetical protein
MDEYKNKYLKYKNKYLELKKSGGGFFGKSNQSDDNEETKKLREKDNILLNLIKFINEYNINNPQNRNIMNSLIMNSDIKEFNKYDYSKSMKLLYSYGDHIRDAMFFLNNCIETKQVDHTFLVFCIKEMKKHMYYLTTITDKILFKDKYTSLKTMKEIIGNRQ